MFIHTRFIYPRPQLVNTKPNSPSLTQICHQQHHPADQTHFPKQQTPPPSPEKPNSMETHKKLIKATPLLSIKPNPKNPEKPDQTHTTIADQTYITIVDQAENT